MRQSPSTAAHDTFAKARVLAAPALGLLILLTLLANLNAAAAAPSLAHVGAMAELSSANTAGYVQAHHKSHRNHGLGFKFKKGHVIKKFGFKHGGPHKYGANHKKHRYGYAYGYGVKKFGFGRFGFKGARKFGGHHKFRGRHGFRYH